MAADIGEMAKYSGELIEDTKAFRIAVLMRLDSGAAVMRRLEDHGCARGQVHDQNYDELTRRVAVIESRPRNGNGLAAGRIRIPWLATVEGVTPAAMTVFAVGLAVALVFAVLTVKTERKVSSLADKLHEVSLVASNYVNGVN
jgi:hypothetical protein